jgi:hypothetical protein
MDKEKYGLKGLKKFAVLAPLSFMMFVGCDRLASFSNKKASKDLGEQINVLNKKESIISNELKGVRLDKEILITKKMIDNTTSDLSDINRLQKKLNVARSEIKADKAERRLVKKFVAEINKRS